VKLKAMFPFQQELSGQTGSLIADSCQNLKKMRLNCMKGIDEDGLIHVIDRLGKKLTTLLLDGYHLSEHAYPYLSNCAR
jgi:hypothetical protein